MSKRIRPEIPLCWSAFADDLDSTTVLLSHGTHPPVLTDPTGFMRPVPLMLASIWESFHIRCVVEATAFIAGFATSPDSLPMELKKRVALEIKQDKDELSPWSMSGDRWRDVLRTRVSPERLRLQSGKSAHVDDFYLRGIGLPRISAQWRDTRKRKMSVASRLNAFIQARDKITHRGEGHLQIRQCWDFRQLVSDQAIRTILHVDAHVKITTGEKFCDATARNLRAGL